MSEKPTGEEQAFRLHELRHDWEMRVAPESWWNGVRVMVRGRTFDGPYAYVKDIVLEKIDEFTEPPSFTLPDRAAQILMDDLWTSGIRPTEKRQDGEALRSVRDHLGDMQQLAFRLLDDKLKG